VTIAAGRKYFNQDPNVLRFVMQNPADRVTYGDLRMIRAEFDELMQLSIEAGTIKRPSPTKTTWTTASSKRSNLWPSACENLPRHIAANRQRHRRRR
jgi:hypothetical protein